MAEKGTLSRTTAGLSANQKKALSALLTSKSVRDAAKTCGLAERTVWRYLAEDLFLQALRSEQSAIYAAASVRLSEGTDKALEELESLMTGAKSEAVKRQAISDWLSYGFKLWELQELESRIAALEERIK